jgi:hypothetical protein
MFLGVVGFVQELIKFTQYRAQLEEILIGKNAPGQQILSRYGGWKRSLDPIQKLLRSILDGLESGQTEEQILAAISNLGHETSNNDAAKDQWKETRSAVRIKASLRNAQRCAICKARLVLIHASNDHTNRRTDGGHDGEGNVQLTHHYCNHGFKEHFAQTHKPMPSNLFKGRHFEQEVIILCVRWYLRYKLSYRDLVEMMAERGLSVAHTTILRWVQRYAPEFGWRPVGCTTSIRTTTSSTCCNV